MQLCSTSLLHRDCSFSSCATRDTLRLFVSLPPQHVHQWLLVTVQEISLLTVLWWRLKSRRHGSLLQVFHPGKVQGAFQLASLDKPGTTVCKFFAQLQQTSGCDSDHC